MNPSFHPLVGILTVNRTENMLATLEIIREKYGGAEKYMTDICGLTKEQVESIRSNLTLQPTGIRNTQQYL